MSQSKFKGNSICRSWQEITPTATEHTGSVRAHTHTHTYTRDSQHQCPDHREFVLSWLGRQDESMRGQLTGHAYSSAKEKREKEGARDSKRNELSPPGATCLAICITYTSSKGLFSSYGMKARKVEKGGRSLGRSNVC